MSCWIRDSSTVLHVVGWQRCDVVDSPACAHVSCSPTPTSRHPRTIHRPSVALLRRQERLQEPLEDRLERKRKRYAFVCLDALSMQACVGVGPG